MIFIIIIIINITTQYKSNILFTFSIKTHSQSFDFLAVFINKLSIGLILHDHLSSIIDSPRQDKSVLCLQSFGKLYSW